MFECFNIGAAGLFVDMMILNRDLKVQQSS